MLLVPGRGKDVLVNLINASNTLPVALSPDTVMFGTPKVDASTPTGVTVALFPVLGSIYTGGAEINYQRMDLSSAFGNIVPKVRGVAGGNLHALLPLINETLGVTITPEDVEEVKLDWLEAGSEVYLPIKALPTSLSYVGAFRIQFYRLRPALADAIAQTALEGFRFVGGDVTGGIRSVTMGTWGLNFTENMDALKLTNVGQWAAFTKLREVMTTLGYPGWPVADPKVARIVDQPTAAVPEANPHFERVVVQKNVVGAGYAGDAYFHYNRS